MITHAMEDYLKCIYELQELGETANTSTLAAWLKISPGSATSMIKRLSELKLVNYRPYEGFKLTRQGKQIALKVVRNHRLIELFLTKILDVPWDRVHKEAHKLEHALSEYVAERIANLLGDPIMDPHGSSIPDRKGRINPRKLRRLTSVKPGQSVIIARVDDENPDLLRFLGDLRLYPETTVEMLEKEPFGGPMHIWANGIEQAVGIQAAMHVWVRVS
jgi:DtxR family Mn-dependent transcriptional regulator